MSEESFNKVQKWRKRLKEDDEKLLAFREKERIRDKKRRQLKKEHLLQNPTSLTAERRKNRLRKRAQRAKKNNDQNKSSTSNNNEQIPYKTTQSFGKAVARVKKVLPSSPTKKRQLF